MRVPVRISRRVLLSAAGVPVAMFLAPFERQSSAIQLDPAIVAAAYHVREIVAHRGSSADRPENTLAAYRRAIESGATGIEVDLRFTRDGHLVSLHDDSLERTTAGSGKLASKTLAEVLQLDAGAWFDARYLNERVPAFRQILELAEGRIDVFLDLKEDGIAYTSQIIDEVRRFGEPDRIIAGVRSIEQAAQFRQDLREARLVGLIPSRDDIEAFVQSGVPVIRLWPEWLPDADLTKRLRNAGAELHITAGRGSREEVIPLLAYRPISLFADDPAQLIRTLEELRAGR